MDRVRPINNQQVPIPTIAQRLEFEPQLINPQTKGTSAKAAGATSGIKSIFKSKIFIAVVIAVSIVLGLGLIAGVILIALYGTSNF